MLKVLQLLFGIKTSVNRISYIFWGITLFCLKFIVAFILYYLAGGRFLTPMNYIIPIFEWKYPDFSDLPIWFSVMMILWILPFVWIGFGMSIRRAANAGFSPWTGLLFFVPFLNYLFILGLCILPSTQKNQWEIKDNADTREKFISPLILVATFTILGACSVLLNANLIGVYGVSLFIWTPLICGMIQGYLLNYKSRQSLKKTIGLVGLTFLLAHFLLIVFALEGVICLVLSLPITGISGLMGATFGFAIARYCKRSATLPVMLLFALPLLSLIESFFIKPHRDVVLSKIEINAHPNQIWFNVIQFSDLPPVNNWLFKIGIAHPIRARIDGEGMGAIRYCEFSTGAFVEPITVWDKPKRLAFSITSQPRPMKELSFYKHVRPPHLNGYFRSIKGEFHLIQKNDKKTILEGRTWYEMKILPGWYWQIYGRWFIHKIHLRVLKHIKNLSE